MKPTSLDLLPLRFWLAAGGSTAILILGLLAVGAIDDGAADGSGIRMTARPSPEALGQVTPPAHRQ